MRQQKITTDERYTKETEPRNNNPTTNAMDEYTWGDEMENIDKSTFRIYTQNVNTLQSHNINQELNDLFSTIQEHNISYFGITEPNLNWHHPAAIRGLHKTQRQNWKQSKLNHSHYENFTKRAHQRGEP